MCTHSQSLELDDHVELHLARGAEVRDGRPVHVQLLLGLDLVDQEVDEFGKRWIRGLSCPRLQSEEKCFIADVVT